MAAAEGFAGVAIPAVGLLYTYTANRRAQYDRVLVMTDQSCTSPISDDRHVAGTAFEPTWKHPPGEPVKLSEAEIKAVFNVLWPRQRVVCVAAAAEVSSAKPNAPPGERRGAVGLPGSRLLHENGRVWEAPGQFGGVARVEDLRLA